MLSAHVEQSRRKASMVSGGDGKFSLNGGCTFRVGICSFYFIGQFKNLITRYTHTSIFLHSIDGTVWSDYCFNMVLYLRDGTL